MNTVLKCICLAVLFCAVAPFVVPSRVLAADQRLFIASPGQPAVIYSCSLNIQSGEFGPLQVAAENVHTEFLAVHPKLPILYAITNESAPGDRIVHGGVRAYRIHRDTGKLEEMSRASTQESQGTTHLAVNSAGTSLGVCHYNGRGSCVLTLNPDGSLQKDVALYVHQGKSITDRQDKPHPHGVAFAPSGTVLCVADLGNDHVEVLHVRSKTELVRASFWSAKPGAGPRHVSFHPNGKWLYSINELDSTLAVLAYDAGKKQLTEVEVVRTLPDDFQGENTTSEVVVHPNGKYLFAANRGHDSTAVFAIDNATGRVRFIEREPTQGNHPRFVGIDPTGKVYLAANRFSGNVVSFHVDDQTGMLTPSGHKLIVAEPMCVAFVP